LGGSKGKKKFMEGYEGINKNERYVFLVGTIWCFLKEEWLRELKIAVFLRDFD
jgi:hypothetical protein